MRQIFLRQILAMRIALTYSNPYITPNITVMQLTWASIFSQERALNITLSLCLKTKFLHFPAKKTPRKTVIWTLQNAASSSEHVYTGDGTVSWMIFRRYTPQHGLRFCKFHWPNSCRVLVVGGHNDPRYDVRPTGNSSPGKCILSWPWASLMRILFGFSVPAENCSGFRVGALTNYVPQWKITLKKITYKN